MKRIWNSLSKFSRSSDFEVFSAVATVTGLEQGKPAGAVVAINQDAYRLMPSNKLFMIAYGFGGHSYEVAQAGAKIACDIITASFQETADDNVLIVDNQPLVECRLVTAFMLANAAVYEQRISHGKLHGMVACAVTVHFAAERLFWAHVGDCRLYRLRADELEQLTLEHSFLNEAVEQQRKFKNEELLDFVRGRGYQEVLVRVIGGSEEVGVDFGHVLLKDGDQFLLCTPGVYRNIAPEKLRDILLSPKQGLQAACDKVVQVANEGNGATNSITAVILEIHMKP